MLEKGRRLVNPKAGHVLIKLSLKRTGWIRKDPLVHKSPFRRVPMNLKKVFSVFVSLTTIGWAMGLGAMTLPSVAAADSLTAGSLIKASGPAVYYYAADGKRYVFPNETTYYSWFQNFNTVQTISDSELASIMIGGNVTIRPGTDLVKITTDPKVYAVTQNGTLHWVESESVASALYGANWAHRVVDVPDAFFVNYTVGSSISTPVHPDGTLISYAGDSNNYVVWGGVKRQISAAAWSANNFNASWVIPTTITYGNGTPVTGYESPLADVISVSGGSVAGGSVMVSLASDTPAGMTVPANASGQKLVKVNFTAGSAPVTITGLTFHRVGIGAVSDFANVYLYDGNSVRLSSGRSINTQTNLVQFNNLNITVAAGTTWSAYVVGDFSAPSNTGGQHSFEIPDAGSVIVSGNATVTGSFPVRGNVFTVGTTKSAEVDVANGTTPANPTIGAQNVEVSNFRVTANTNDVTLNQITLYQAGSITNSDLSNLQLYQGSTVVATAPAINSDGHVVLQFATPYVITNGTTKVFSLHATVGGRAGRTIIFYVEYTTDVMATDNVYNAGAQVCISTGCGTFSGTPFDGTSTSNESLVTTQGGTLTNAFNGPVTQNVAKGMLGVPFYNFALSSPDNTLEIRKMVFTIAKTAGSAGTCAVKGTSGTNYFRSIKIVNTDTGTTVMGPIEIPSATANSATTATLTFTDTFDIAAGQTMNLALESDLSNSEDAGDTFLDGACSYQATFSPFGTSDVRVPDTGEFLDTSKIIPNSSVTGNAQTIKSSNLNVDLASTPVSGTIVKKQQNVPVAGITLTASAQSDITITNLTLSGQASINGAPYAANQFAQRVTSLSLWNGTTEVGTAQAPDTTTGKAQITNMNLLIPHGTTLNLTVAASFSSSASTVTPDKVSVGIASATDIQAQDNNANTVTPNVSTALMTTQLGTTPAVAQTILNSGTITIQTDSNPVSNIVVAGKDAWIPMAQYSASAQYEDVSIDRVAVLASSTAGLHADNADIAAVAIAENGAVMGQDTLSAGATGTKDIDLSASPIVVAKDHTIDFQVWVKLANVVASSSVSGATSGVARSGDAPAMGLMSGLTTGEWDSNYSGMLNVRSTGVASGERIYTSAAQATQGNSMIMRKTMPVVTLQSLSSTVLGNIQQDLIKFQVAADPSNSVDLKQVMFKVSLSGNVSLSNFRMRRGASDIQVGTYSITEGDGTDLTSGSMTSSSNQFVVFTFSAAQKESISQSGNVYTLYANVAGANTGDSVQVQFYRDPTAPVVTGYLLNSSAFDGLASSANIFNIDTALAPSGAAAATGTFLWSDNSETAQHSDLSQGSRDWTNDVYVQDLTQSQQLTK